MTDRHPAIPTELAEVTPEWLGGALGARVDAVQVLDSHSGTTGRVRLALRGSGAPASVFVKLAPFDAAQREFVSATRMGVREARLYRDLAAELPVRMPCVWYADFDAEGRYVMVLEDLAAAGCSFPSPGDPRVGAWAGQIVEQLARLHARFHESPRFAGDLAWAARFGGGGSGGGDTAVNLVKLALDRLGDRLAPGFRRHARLYIERARTIAALWSAGPATLIHGDPHLGNLFVDGERIGFLDWAVVSRAPGMRDVAYVLCNSVPTELRRAHEREWIAAYCGRLAAGGVALDLDRAWEQYRLFALYSWLAATTTLAMGSKWQPERIGLAATQRTTQALEDLRSAELIE
ncbi:MAG TPA: aminoglycoside phosphotransferase family protein [Myxococcota bacterium]|nr:aminoglycoside phosphotransferase family protein [Myxococcota bacterium]